MLQLEPGQLNVRRLLVLYVLFFLICLGLGYPILNRIDWHRAPGGLVDLRDYASLVTSPPSPDPQQHVQFRVLVPYLARPFYYIARNHIGSWDPVMFGLLVANSIFVSGTVTVLALLALDQMGSYAVALGSALLYLLNFAVPNLRLVGFIDSGEAFFLLLVVWSLSRERYALLPLWAVGGALAKESFVPFLLVFTAAWWVASRKTCLRRAGSIIWIGSSWAVALATLVLLQWRITGLLRSPLQFGIQLHGHVDYHHFSRVLRDGNVWYTFVWLLPLGIPRLRRLSSPWRAATAVTCACALALDAYYGAAPGAVARAFFTIAGPLLTASAAWLVFEPNSRTATGTVS